MWRCVDRTSTDVSEECIASIFRVEKWRRYVPPKRLLTHYLHSATSQKTTLFKVKSYLFAIFRLRYLAFNFSTIRLNLVHSTYSIRTGVDSYLTVCRLVCSNYPGMGRPFFPYEGISFENNCSPPGWRDILQFLPWVVFSKYEPTYSTHFGTDDPGNMHLQNVGNSSPIDRV
jgi:hypothetical protein